MRGAIVGACVWLCAAPVFAQSPTPRESYESLIALYRKGGFERAVSELRFLSIADIHEPVMLSWAREARRAERRDDLAAALMLHSEVIFAEVANDPGRLRFNVIVRTHDHVIAAIHQQLRGYSRTAPILRTWYLLWEAFRQGLSLIGKFPLSDYLSEGMSAFPDDADMLLTAGSRHEMMWWRAPQNPLRDPSEGDRIEDGSLKDARRYFQRSVDADPKAIEARIRLGRALTLLGEFDKAGEQLTGASRSGQPAFEYLRFLFLGDLRERQNDPAGALLAYEEAIGLTPSPQSARLAAAQVSHGMGRRSDASRAAMQAMATPRETSDPWWAYQRGQWWRIDYYIKHARGLILNRGGAATR